MEPKDSQGDRRDFAKQLVAYADAITAFSLVQAIAFGLALSQTELHNSVIRWSSYVLCLISGAYILYLILAALCFLGESQLRRFEIDGVIRRWRIIGWICRLLVLSLALGISLLSVILTVKHGLAEDKNCCVATPHPDCQQTPNAAPQPKHKNDDPMNLYGPENKQLSECLSKVSPRDPAGIYQQTPEQAKKREDCIKQFGNR
jgi:hypothetical protein